MNKFFNSLLCLVCMALVGCPAPQRTLLLNRSNKTVSVKQGDSIINLDPGDRCIIAKQINTILIDGKKQFYGIHPNIGIRVDEESNARFFAELKSLKRGTKIVLLLEPDRQIYVGYIINGIPRRFLKQPKGFPRGVVK